LVLLAFLAKAASARQRRLFLLLPEVHFIVFASRRVQMRPLFCKIAALTLGALARAPLRPKRNFSSAGSDDAFAPKGKARAAPRGSAKSSAATLGQPHVMNNTIVGSSSADVTGASKRVVRRFTVCDDASAAATQLQNFWWAAGPPAFVMGIDCSVRSTGYCVLRMPTDHTPPKPHHMPMHAASASPHVAACGSISTGVGAAASVDPARFLTDVRACLLQVKRDVEHEYGQGKWLVVVEECLMQFQGRRSSADTIVNLARFNALVSGECPHCSNKT
jgi:hypothetical protein